MHKIYFYIIPNDGSGEIMSFEKFNEKFKSNWSDIGKSVLPELSPSEAYEMYVSRCKKHNCTGYEISTFVASNENFGDVFEKIRKKYGEHIDIIGDTPSPQ